MQHKGSNHRFAHRMSGAVLAGFVGLLTLFAAGAATAAPVIAQVTPTSIAPGGTLTLTVRGADTQVTGNNLVNFIQLDRTGSPKTVAQAAARSVKPLAGTTLAQLVVTVPTSVPPSTTSLTVDGQVSVQVGTSGASSASTALQYHSGPSLFSTGQGLAFQGQTVNIPITGSFTNFRKGITRANFGPGISVGGAPAGTSGPVTVTDSLHAVASIQVTSGAAAGLRDVTVATGAESVTSSPGIQISPAGTPVIRPFLSANMLALEKVGGSVAVTVSAVAYDGNGNTINPMPAFTISVALADGSPAPTRAYSVSGSAVTFTQYNSYAITVTATIGGQSVSGVSAVDVGPPPVQSGFGATKALHYQNLAANAVAVYAQLVTALMNKDSTAIGQAGVQLRSFVNGVDSAGLSAAKLMGTAANPNVDYVPAGSVTGLGTISMPAASDLDPNTLTADATYVQTLRAVSAEVDVITALLAAIDPANVKAQDNANLNAELQKLQALADAISSGGLSPRGMVVNLPLIETVLGTKLPAVQKTLALHTLAILNANGYNVKRPADGKVRSALYTPGADSGGRLRTVQFTVELISALGIENALTNMAFNVYGTYLRDIEIDVVMMALGDLIPQDQIVLTYDQDGFCDNAVTPGTAGAIYLQIPPDDDAEATLIGPKAIAPFYDQILEVIKDPKQAWKNIKSAASKLLNPLTAYKEYKDIKKKVDDFEASVKSGISTLTVADGTMGYDLNYSGCYDGPALLTSGFGQVTDSIFQIVGILLVKTQGATGVLQVGLYP